MLLVPLLLIVPGVILLRALRVSGEAVATHPVYVPSASLIVLMSSGLGVDLVGPLFGESEPLRAVPLLIGLEIVCAVLLICSVNVPREMQIDWNLISRSGRLAWPLLIPLAAAAGALRLNNGYSNHVAVAALVASIALVAMAFLRAPRLDETLLVVIVYAISLGMKWSFSLRGNQVYGWDISNEYYSLQQTVQTGVWHFSHVNDSYGAMLSVTVLPAELHALSGVSALLVFKVIYPAIGALFPVAIYSLSRRVVARRWAFLAATLVVMQEPFFQQFPALARQEIATVLFSALIVALLDTSLSRFSRWAMVCLLTLGIVVSHYSTTYLAIPILGMVALFQFVVSWFRPVPRLAGTMMLAFVVSLGGAFAWDGLITHSASNVSQFVAAAEGQGVNILPNRSGNLLSTYLQGEENPELTPAQYQKYISQYYKTTVKYVTPLPDASESQYAVQPASDPSPAVRWSLGSEVLNLNSLLVQQLINLLAGIGALMLALRRGGTAMARRIGLLAVAGVLLLVLVRISGTIAQEYNPERALLQAMVVLAVAVCWPISGLGAQWKSSRPAVLTVCAAGVALFFASSSGLSAVALGGGTATNLANRFDDYQEFDVTTQEIASASWVNRAAPPGQLMYADPYGQLRLSIVAGHRSRVLSDITPETLDQHAWVYADRTNTVDNIARSQTGNHVATYAFPKRFLDANFNLVYTNGTSEVFHR